MIPSPCLQRTSLPSSTSATYTPGARHWRQQCASWLQIKRRWSTKTFVNFTSIYQSCFGIPNIPLCLFRELPHEETSKGEGELLRLAETRPAVGATPETGSLQQESERRNGEGERACVSFNFGILLILISSRLYCFRDIDFSRGGRKRPVGCFEYSTLMNFVFVSVFRRDKRTSFSGTGRRRFSRGGIPLSP